MDLYALLQLADTAWPTGGFAFSQGLESHARLGLIADEKTFTEYLDSYLGQVASHELPFLNSAFQFCFLQNEAQKKEFKNLAEEWNASLTAAPIKKASITQGKAWLRLVEAVYPTFSVQSFLSALTISRRLTNFNIPPHFLLVYAWVMKSLACDLETAQTLFFHLALRDQMSAAIRLGLLGPLQAQTLQIKLQKCCRVYRERYGNLDYTQAQRTAPLIDIGQSYSPQLYSRLFQN